MLRDLFWFCVGLVMVLIAIFAGGIALGVVAEMTPNSRLYSILGLIAVVIFVLFIPNLIVSLYGYFLKRKYDKEIMKQYLDTQNRTRKV